MKLITATIVLIGLLSATFANAQPSNSSCQRFLNDIQSSLSLLRQYYAQHSQRINTTLHTSQCDKSRAAYANCLNIQQIQTKYQQLNQSYINYVDAYVEINCSSSRNR